MKDKEVIIAAIEKRKQDLINELDGHISEIELEDNLARVYFKLVKVFRNNNEQGELGIKLLRRNFENKFFKEAETKNALNGVQFIGEDYTIVFPKAYIRNIEIVFTKSSLNPKHVYSIVNQNGILELAELTQEYLNNKNLKNLNNLVRHNTRNYRKNPIAFVLKYRNTIRGCNQELVNEIRAKERAVEAKKIEVEEHNKELEKTRLEIRDFINSLTDLNIFREDGWSITVKDKDGHIDRKNRRTTTSSILI